MSWAKRILGAFLNIAFHPSPHCTASSPPRARRILVEPLEDRRLLSLTGSLDMAAGEFDFGDAPDNYGTTLAADGARHEATGPTLGATRDAEADGLPTVGADGDDTDGSADEDGVTFGSTITVGQLDASVTVNVQYAPSGAKLDAWIDFNQDGSWGGAFERIASAVDVTPGDNTIEFDVPSWALDGQTYARFRLSTGGGLGPSGAASDGEVEDHQVTIVLPGLASGDFVSRTPITESANGANGVFSADVDGDGDMDVLSASGNDDKIAWYENDGDGSFAAHTITTSADGAHSVFAADVDGDGDMDVLSASLTDDKIAWYENDGDQNFTAHTITTSADGAHSVFAADLDGDGDMDALSASWNDDKIVWYENDGDQTFAAHTISSDGPVYAADVDGDGDMDVLSASNADHTIAWYENDGDANFTAQTIATYDVPGWMASLCAADVDGDGDMDVLSADAECGIAWYENDGNENFTTHTITTSTRMAVSVFAADVDGDGDLDVLSASNIDDKIAWYENDGDRNFTAHTITTSAHSAWRVFAADLDGDGDLDVLSVSGSGGSDKIAWYEQVGSPTLASDDFGDAPDNYGTTLAADGARHEAIGPTLGPTRDAEPDGLPTPTADGDDSNATDDEDGVTFPATIRVGQLDASVIVNVQNAPSGAKLDAWIDFNQDGSWGGPFERIASAVDVTPGDNTIEFDVPSWALDGQTYARFRLSTGGDLGPSGAASDGEVEDYQVTIMPPGLASGDFVLRTPVTEGVREPATVFSADLDGDGDMDVLSASDYSDTVVWYENDGTGSFTAHTISANGAGSVFAADVDGDGDVDVLSCGGSGIFWYENDGNGSFTAHTITTPADEFYSVRAADMDGDGDMDVLPGRSRSGTGIYWYENDGDENFTVQMISSSDGGRAFPADIDGDGDVDVLSASSSDNKISWHENDGSQSFTTHTITTSADDLTSVLAADIDGDGDMDVLSGTHGLDTGTGFYWYENDGDEQFTARKIGSSHGAMSVFAADLDGDGDLDVLSGSPLDGEIFWLENDGNKHFTAHTIAASDALTPISVFAADLDGDGDLDVLSVDVLDTGIAWYEQVGSPTLEYLDFGDAPDSYASTAVVDGARHEPIGPTLGATRDAETNGKPTTDADGDDADNSDDEDGVTFDSITVGQFGASATVNLQNAPGGAKLDAWIDFDGDGSFEAGDRIADDLDLSEGDNLVEFDVPVTALEGNAYARFRLSSAGGLGPAGSANDGEVEDYRTVVLAQEMDFGDAPDSYGTSLAADGARHKATGPTLGHTRDPESDGLPRVTADGDDTNATPDEDGVTFSSTVIVGQLDASATVNVQNAPGGARLDAWIDFNHDGSWGGLSEQIAAGIDVVTGDNTIEFDVPSWALDGEAYARFRLSTSGNLAPTGRASDGEVEDHQVAIVPPGPASGEFVSRTPISGSAGEVMAVFPADVDGDGDMDVLFASRNDDKIAWYENDGDQNFTAHTITTSADGAYSVFAADVDGDGDIDVLSASIYDRKVAWYENDGSENFAAHTISFDGNAPVFALDMDGDGDIDVLSKRNVGSTVVSWYENDGDENFTAHPIFSDGYGGVYPADMDGDGDMDVLSASTRDVSWHENDGNQNFTEREISDVNMWLGYESVFAADLDGDGDMDVLATSGRKITWYENDGDESFTAHTIASTFFAGSVFAADLDGDGDMDVLSTSLTDDTIVWYENDGNGAFSAHTITTSAGQARSAFAADMDGDGDLDVLSALTSADKIAWYEQVGSPTLASDDFGDAPDNYGTTLAADGARHEATGPTLGTTRDADLDGLPSVGADGDDTDGSADEDGVTFGSTIMVGQLDASVTVNVQDAPSGAKLDAWIDFNQDGSWGGAGEQIADTVDVSEGDNAIQFDVPSWAVPGETYARFRLSSVGDLGPSGWAADGEVEDYRVTISPTAPEVVFGPRTEIVNLDFAVFCTNVADFNDDGHLDLLVGTQFMDTKISWWENDGNAGFTEHTITSSVQWTDYLLPADVNGDGRTDFLSRTKSADHSQQIVSWWENDGSANFTQHVLATVGKAYRPVAADINGDGRMDLLTSEDKITWHENDGNENFTQHTIATSAGDPVATDVNRDGHMDVVVDVDGGGIVWYENDGNENFTEHTISLTGVSGGWSPLAADFNGDGHMDVAASITDGTYAWYENDGNENFTEHTVTPSFDIAGLTAAADMNGDGHMDLLAACYYAVAWYVNNGDGTFTEQLVGDGIEASLFANPGDIDGDGDLDVAFACIWAAGWFENLGEEYAAVDLGPVDFQELPDLDLTGFEKAYSFTTTNAGYLTVDVTFDSAAGDVTLRLLDDQGQPIDEVTGGDGYLRIDHTDPSGGTAYELRVSGTNPSVDLRICNLVSPAGTNVEVFGTDGSDTFDFAISETYDVSVNGVEYGFDRGQTDLIQFSDGGGADSLTITGTDAFELAKLIPGGVDYWVYGDNMYVRAADVEVITVNSGGGDDIVEMFDSDGDDTLTATPTQMVLTGTPIGGSAFSATANGFRYAHGYAKAGGNDAAEFVGSDQSERVKVYPTFVKLIGNDYYNRAKFFETATVQMFDGNDTGRVVAADGVDVLWAMKDECRVARNVQLAPGERPDFDNMAYDVTVFGCPWLVALADGNDDWVQLHDTALNDVLIAKPHKIEVMNAPRYAEGVLRAAEYRITARRYQNVSAVADQGGTGDKAKLYDSGNPGVDVWAAAYVDGETWSTMTSPARLLYEIAAFERIGGYGFNGGLGENHGTNRKDHAQDVDFVFQYGYWE